MHRTEALTEAMHAAAEHKRAAASRDVLTARLAATMAADAQRIYTVVGASSDDPTISDVAALAGLLSGVVGREVAAAVAAVRSDLERDYQAKLSGFEAAIGRTVTQWRREIK